MKASKFLSLFILIGLFATGLTFGNADALEYTHYYEENIVCASTTTSAQPVVVEDGVDFDFIDGHKYLIIATSTWAGADNTVTYEINMQHGNATVGTIFDGSQSIVEPQHTSTGCDNGDKMHKFWHWVIWNPVGVEQAGEDIAINYISSGTEMTYDDVTMFVLEISEDLVEDEDWFYDSNTTDEPLDDVGWGTNSSATLSFTPSVTEVDDDWLILGTALLEVDDIIDQFETRLNFENNTSLTPYLSQEGEDPTGTFVQSFSRVFTLNNTQAHDFTVESRTDALSVGSNQRLFNGIFALNLDRFESHNATYYENPITILESVTPYTTEVMTLDIQNNATKNWYIFGGFTKESDKDALFRLQIDNVDSPDDQTTQKYELSHNWDQTDFVINGIGTFESLDNSTHTIDVDGSIKDGAGDRDRDADSRSIWAFTLDANPNKQRVPTDDITWSDNSTMVISILQNATDTVTWSDSVDGTSPVLTNQTTTDDITWSDFVDSTFSISQIIPTDTITWNDNSTMTFDVSQDVTDTVTWSDSVEMTFDVSQVAPTDTVTWEDEVLMVVAFNQEVTDIVTWEDDISITTMYFSDVLDGTVTWEDEVDMEVAFDMDSTDTVTWSDSVTGFVDASGEVTDIITWEDDVEMTTMYFSDVLDGTVTWEDDTEMTFDVSLVAPTDIVTWEDTVSMVVAFDMSVDDTVTWEDTNTATISAFAIIVGDTIGWQDASGYGFDPHDPPFPVIPPTPTVPSSTPSGGGIVPTNPDSDGDGFTDNVDGCPFDAENFNDYEDSDGCPDTIPIVVVPTVPDTGLLPFELSQFDVVDDNIILEEESVRPQVEDLTVRWLGDQAITITNVEVADSPFEFQFDDIPRNIGTSDLGITESQIEYTVKAPRQVCTNDFTFDCVSDVTYDIPIIITGEVDGKVIITEGRIRVDNSDRTNPYTLILAVLVLIPILAILLWKKTRKKETSLRVIRGGKPIAHGRNNIDYLDERAEGKSRLILRKPKREKQSLIRPRDKSSKTKTNIRLIDPKKREGKTFTFRDPNKEKKKKKRNFLGR